MPICGTRETEGGAPEREREGEREGESESEREKEISSCVVSTVFFVCHDEPVVGTPVDLLFVEQRMQCTHLLIR